MISKKIRIFEISLWDSSLSEFYVNWLFVDNKNKINSKTLRSVDKLIDMQIKFLKLLIVIHNA